MSVWDRWFHILFPWDEPSSRLNLYHLLATFLLILFWVAQRKKLKIFRNKRFWNRYFFFWRYWWNPSTRWDYILYFFNNTWKALLFFPALAFSYWVAKLTFQFLELIPKETPLPLTPWNMALFTFLAFVWDDFWRFLHHYLSHQIPWLWYFHKTHHSATTLTPITLFRTHPVESFLGWLRNGWSLGVTSGVFVFLFDQSLNLWTVSGVNIFGYIFNLLGGNLRHSHIPLSFGWFDRIIISPMGHQIHHSVDPRHHNKNFGVSLAIWDYILGTLETEVSVKALRFGLLEKSEIPRQVQKEHLGLAGSGSEGPVTHQISCTKDIVPS